MFDSWKNRLNKASVDRGFIPALWKCSTSLSRTFLTPESAWNSHLGSWKNFIGFCLRRYLRSSQNPCQATKVLKHVCLVGLLIVRCTDCICCFVAFGETNNLFSEKFKGFLSVPQKAIKRHMHSVQAIHDASSCMMLLDFYVILGKWNIFRTDLM